MKKITKIKAMFLAMMMLLGLIAPITSIAQKSDGFFRGGNNDIYQNRDAGINDEGGISNYGIGEEVPLGSGLLILTAVGAGYAIMRRKSYKAYKTHGTNKSYNCGATLFLSLALILSITGCKKNVETISSAATEGVFITLDVDGDNSGSKVIVNPTGHTNPDYATVTFENGDIIYVGNNGKYCGYLEHNGTIFAGTVNPESEDDYLHFYFMGNKGAKSQPSSVSITDQTSKYPVISYARSKQLYNSGTSSYTAKLQNYCAIVKFATPDISQTNAITITGMNNTVTVDFSANNAASSETGDPYSFSAGDGKIKLHAESNTERWAILLPKNTATTSTASAEGYVPNGTFTVPAIDANTYHSTGITVSMKPVYFSVNSNSTNSKVLFAPGNLQAKFTATGTSSCTWQFAEHQYDYIGNATANTAVGNNQVTSVGTVDLFGWVDANGTLAAYGINNSTDQAGYGTSYSTLKKDWGEAASGLGGHNDWYTLSKDEWGYVFNNTARGSYRYLKAKISANSTTYNGVILFPDGYDGSIGSYTYNNSSSNYTSVSAADWTAMENAGAVFLPAVGSRSGTTVSEVGERGLYWSTDNGTYSHAYACHVLFHSTSVYPNNAQIAKSTGCSVRLVRIVN